MGTITIKDRDSDYQAKVDATGHVYVTTAGSGGMSNVNIFDSSGNTLNSTSGALNVFVENPGGNTGWSNFAQSTPKQVAVTGASTQLLAANTNRLYARISNNSSQTIYLQYGVSAIYQQGLRMSPGASFAITTIELFQGIINAITSSGSVNIDVIEGVL
jgi:hypothetical protein